MKGHLTELLLTIILGKRTQSACAKIVENVPIYIKSLACLYVCMYVCMYACLDFELKRPDQYDGKLKAES